MHVSPTAGFSTTSPDKNSLSETRQDSGSHADALSMLSATSLGSSGKTCVFYTTDPVDAAFELRNLKMLTEKGFRPGMCTSDDQEMKLVNRLLMHVTLLGGQSKKYEKPRLGQIFRALMGGSLQFFTMQHVSWEHLRKESLGGFRDAFEDPSFRTSRIGASALKTHIGAEINPAFVQVTGGVSVFDVALGVCKVFLWNAHSQACC